MLRSLPVSLDRLLQISQTGGSIIQHIIIVSQILERAKAVRETANPEADARAAQALAQMRGEIAPNGKDLLSFKEFSDFIKQQSPKVTRESPRPFRRQ